MSLIVVMGSGETAPPMVRTHREVFERVGTGPSFLLDTPFAFQENAGELIAKAQRYFAQTVGHRVDVARWRVDAPVMERELALASVGQARWAFAGPGSPTYALRHWRGTAVPRALADVVRRGGALVLGSAAAVTAGSHALPVYEIYKAGQDPEWATGLDLLADLAGLRAAVIPHFNNAEGGTHDTRFCYLGRRRLDVLEAALPEEVGVLGVDEHTALLLDLASGTAHVRGNASVTVWRGGPVRELSAGAELTLSALAALLSGQPLPSEEGGMEVTSASRSPSDASGSRPDSAGQAGGGQSAGAGPDGSGPAPPSLRGEVEHARERFDQALAAGDVGESVAAVLDAEEAISAWGTDVLQSDDPDRARADLRAMVARLGELARIGARDPREVVGPYVEALLDVRRTARDAGDFATADQVREKLTSAGVEVRDTPSGTEWHLLGGRGCAT